MMDLLFVSYFVLLALMLGFAVAGDVRRRSRNGAKRQAAFQPADPDIA